jgi:2-amino-1-hydroxyethylphosphonate dioxygenase (glycine-forming)
MNKTQINNSIIAAEIIQLFGQYGSEDYDGEPVSQTSHMVQCAMQAMSEGADMELILGAFLHDIGHLLKHIQQTEAMGTFGVLNHEAIGAAYLKQNGFSERICTMVSKHVDAKRYLVATDNEYAARLSPSSKQTLIFQGGPMSEEEIFIFKQHPFFDDIIRVRLWDEMAKDANAEILPLQHFNKLINSYLNDQ